MRLKPAGKDYIWGGTRLKDEFSKEIDMEPLAETWECSTHPDGLSFVSGGEFDGKTLASVIREHPDYIGSHPDVDEKDGNPDLPVLIKLIDANQDLSVQVHPDDSYAFENEEGQRGKTEMWYVLDAEEGASIVYGLNCDIDSDQFKKSISEGTVGKYLQKVHVRTNDILFIEPGTIHAIGAGVLVAEIQENSNLTYRLYDYDRTDKNGVKRTLHIDKAMDVACLNKAGEARQPMRVLRYVPGIARELLGRCKYFEVHRLLINAKQGYEPSFKADELSFRVLLCIEGSGLFLSNNGEMKINKGDCFFVPANSVDIRFRGKMMLLDVRG